MLHSTSSFITLFYDTHFSSDFELRLQQLEYPQKQHVYYHFIHNSHEFWQRCIDFDLFVFVLPKVVILIKHGFLFKSVILQYPALSVQIGYNYIHEQDPALKIGYKYIISHMLMPEKQDMDNQEDVRAYKKLKLS